MNKNTINSVYSIVNVMYGITMDTTNFEDICLMAWERIGNRPVRIYKYTTNTINGRVQLPCNVDHIEAVFSPEVDAHTSSPTSVFPNIYNQWTEEYIESWKRDKNIFYNKGHLISYHLEGDTLVCDRDYHNLTILYRGVIVDDDGLPYLSDKEVQAIAAFCAYMDTYKKSLVLKDGNLFKMAESMKMDWIRLCANARTPDHISQNEMNDVLDVKARWDRKVFGKAFKPII